MMHPPDPAREAEPHAQPAAADRGAVARRGDTATVVGVLLVVLGGLFLVGNLFPDLRLGRYAWPFFVILPGLALFVAMVLGGRQLASLAVPASIVTTTGLILLVQNTLGVWETWAYAWALVAPTAVGVGVWLSGAWGDRPDLVQSGQRLALVGLVLFALFAVFFELVIGLSPVGRSELVRLGAPALLVAAGIYLLLQSGRRAAR